MRAACNLGFWQEFLLSIPRGQFGILEGVPSAYLTLRSPRSGPRAIWDFGGSFLCLSHFMLSSEQTARNLGFWQEFLMFRAFLCSKNHIIVHCVRVAYFYGVNFPRFTTIHFSYTTLKTTVSSFLMK